MARPAIIAASVGDLDTLSVSFTRHLRAANLALRDHTYSEPTRGADAHAAGDRHAVRQREVPMTLPAGDPCPSPAMHAWHRTA
jgi:hypothetical protein